jgi:uncharacterized protein (TIGR03437 family)
MKSLLALILVVPAFSQTSDRPSVTAAITASAFGAYPGVAAPASYVEIYGTNLAGTTRGWANSDFTGNKAPNSLDGVTVSVNGLLAYVNYVSPRQVNIEIPDGIPPGPVPVIVNYGGQSSAAVNLTINAAQPGLLTTNSSNLAAFHSSSGALVTTSTPATPGETLILYGTGFGPTAKPPVAGQIASGQTPLAGTLSATLGGTPVTIQYAGLAPGLVGVYQFNLVVPSFVGSGNLAFQFTLNNVPYTLQTLSIPGSGLTGNPTAAFALTSTAGVNNGLLPADYTCDGTGSTLPLSWSNAPLGTKEFAVLMTTLPGDGTTKWNWVLYHIPATVTSLTKDSFLVGTLGVGSDGPGTIYNPPCSQGPGAKLYTYTLYALSAAPTFSVPATQVNGQLVTDAISSLTLATATLNLSYSRPTNPPGSSTACGYIVNSMRASKSGASSVNCDGKYAYISSLGITTQPMMNGITSTNLQVPTPQNFLGANGWKIPLAPTIAAAPTDVTDGPIGVAINGVPIFNPCTQGGCVTGGDTKVLGQLDNCNGHAGRADDYHYHAAPNCMMADQPANYWDTHPLGWALDGFAIFGYHDSDGTTALRDAICGGNTKPNPNSPAGYSYHVTDASPYVAACLIGVPSPDLPNQSAKYHPFRQPPVTPFVDSNMTLTTDPTDGYQVLQFTSAITFKTNETGTDSYSNPPGTYKIRYIELTGTALATQLALKPNSNATACWNFQFLNSAGATTQPTVTYCK